MPTWSIYQHPFPITVQIASSWHFHTGAYLWYFSVIDNVINDHFECFGGQKQERIFFLCENIISVFKVSVNDYKILCHVRIVNICFFSS